MRFLKKKIYYIPAPYIMTGRIIVLYIYLARAKIISYIDAVILISIIIYRFILLLIVLIWVFYFSFGFSQIPRILISVLNVIRVFGSMRYVYSVYAFRLRFREKWISSYFSDTNFIPIFFYLLDAAIVDPY